MNYIYAKDKLPIPFHTVLVKFTESVYRPVTGFIDNNKHWHLSRFMDRQDFNKVVLCWAEIPEEMESDERNGCAGDCRIKAWLSEGDCTDDPKHLPDCLISELGAK